MVGRDENLSPPLHHKDCLRKAIQCNRESRYDAQAIRAAKKINMDGIDLGAIRLYWFMIWAVVGSAITPLIFDRRNRNPWQGAIIGLIVGVLSGQVFGYLLLTMLISVVPDLATWIGATIIVIAGVYVWHRERVA